MRKSMITLLDKVVRITLNTNVNSTTSVACYQPKLPKSVISNFKNK